MTKTQEQFIEYLAGKPRVMDASPTGPGVVVLRENTSGAATFDKAANHGWRVSVWNESDEYDLAVFMPITGEQ